MTDYNFDMLFLHRKYSLCISIVDYMLIENVFLNTSWGKSRFTVVSETQFILVLLYIYYCIIFYKINCKPTFAPPYIILER